MPSLLDRAPRQQRRCHSDFTRQLCLQHYYPIAASSYQSSALCYIHPSGHDRFRTPPPRRGPVSSMPVVCHLHSARVCLLWSLPRVCPPCTRCASVLRWRAAVVSAVQCQAYSLLVFFVEFLPTWKVLEVPIGILQRAEPPPHCLQRFTPLRVNRLRRSRLAAWVLYKHSILLLQHHRSPLRYCSTLFQRMRAYNMHLRLNAKRSQC